MSVDLIIRYTDAELDDEIPIAGTINFMEYWLEPSKALGLEMIPIMDSLITVDKSAISELLNDIYKLRNYLATNDELDQKRISSVFVRIENAIRVLEKALKNWDKVKYVSCG